MVNGSGSASAGLVDAFGCSVTGAATRTTRTGQGGVLDLLLPHILEDQSELVADLVADLASLTGPRFPMATVLPRSGNLQPALREWVSQMADHRQHAPATLRNRDAILGVLRSVLPTTGIVLEIASGTGEHIVHFAQDLAGLIFQPSDPDPDALLSVSAWVEATRSTNVRLPVILDASQPPWPIASANGIICINMIHVSPWKATVGLMRGAGEILPPAAPLYLYGPYKRQNIPTAASNKAFDQSVRDYEPTWGLRDLEAVAAMAQSAGFSEPVITEMPANNLSVVFRRL